MQKLIHGVAISVCHNGEYLKETETREGIINWVNATAVCFMSVGVEYVIPWTSIRFLRVLKT